MFPLCLTFVSKLVLGSSPHQPSPNRNDHRERSNADHHQRPHRNHQLALRLALGRPRLILFRLSGSPYGLVLRHRCRCRGIRIRNLRLVSRLCCCPLLCPLLRARLLLRLPLRQGCCVFHLFLCRRCCRHLRLSNTRFISRLSSCVCLSRHRCLSFSRLRSRSGLDIRINHCLSYYLFFDDFFAFLYGSDHWTGSRSCWRRRRNSRRRGFVRHHHGGGRCCSCLSCRGCCCWRLRRSSHGRSRHSSSRRSCRLSGLRHGHRSSWSPRRGSRGRRSRSRCRRSSCGWLRTCNHRSGCSGLRCRCSKFRSRRACKSQTHKKHHTHHQHDD